MRLGSGICRVRELRRAGSPVGLAVDGSASNDSSNLLAELRQTLLLQPLLATVWGWLLFGERLAPLQLVGALLTLGAIYAGTLGLGRRPARDAQASRS